MSDPTAPLAGLSLADPFAQLIAPQEVLHAVEHSERLARLRRRVYRPLDRPWIPLRAGAEFDAAVQAQDMSEIDTDIDLAD